MSAYDPGRYGEAVSDYDALYPGADAQTRAAVDLVVELAARDPHGGVLEFGIGTGRLALGLTARGVQVSGIDGSPRMLDQLKAKPGGAQIPVLCGDYRDAHMAGRFSVVLLAINGIFDPRGRRAQLDIFANAAWHLTRGGFFVVESWVMSDVQRNGDWAVVPRFVAREHVELQLSRYDIESNTIERTLVHLLPAGLEFVTVTDTYASPGELDVMGEVSGFRRSARYCDWDRHEFTAASSYQISVFQRT